MFPSTSCIIRGQYHVLVLAKHWITVFPLRCNNNILRTETDISPSRGHSLINVFLIKYLHTSGNWKLLSRLKKWFLAYSYLEFHLKKHVIVGIKEEKLNLWKLFIASLNNSRLLSTLFKRHDSKSLFPILLSSSLSLYCYENSGHFVWCWAEKGNGLEASKKGTEGKPTIILWHIF